MGPKHGTWNAALKKTKFEHRERMESFPEEGASLGSSFISLGVSRVITALLFVALLTLTVPGKLYAATTTLSAGQLLNVNTATALASGTLSISGGTLDNTSGVSVTVSFPVVSASSCFRAGSCSFATIVRSLTKVLAVGNP